MAHQLTAMEVVQKNLDCYNNRDINGFMESFSSDIALYTFSEDIPTTTGLSAVEKLYKNLFEQSPNLYSTIISRIVFDNKVIDHESIVGRLRSEDIVEIVLIYEVKEEKIFKITAIRK